MKLRHVGAKDERAAPRSGGLLDSAESPQRNAQIGRRIDMRLNMGDDSAIAGHRFIARTAQMGVERQLKFSVWVRRYGLNVCSMVAAPMLAPQG